LAPDGRYYFRSTIENLQKKIFQKSHVYPKFKGMPGIALKTCPKILESFFPQIPYFDQNFAPQSNFSTSFRPRFRRLSNKNTAFEISATKKNFDRCKNSPLSKIPYFEPQFRSLKKIDFWVKLRYSNKIWIFEENSTF